MGVSKTVILQNVRLSYAGARLFTPHPGPQNGPETYSVAVMVPKSSQNLVKLLQSSVAEVMDMGKKQKIITRAQPQVFITDGDEGDREDYRGYYVFSAKRKPEFGAPNVRDEANRVVVDPEMVYSGVWANINMNVYAHQNGIAFGLNGVQRTRDDERLDGGVNAEDMFEKLVDDSDDSNMTMSTPSESGSADRQPSPSDDPFAF
jgi:hypothetical protein